MTEPSTPRAAFGVTHQGAMPADRRSRIGGIPGWWRHPYFHF